MSKSRVFPVWFLALCSNLIGFGLLNSVNITASALPMMDNANASTRLMESSTLRNAFVPPNDQVPAGSRTRGAAARGPACAQSTPQGIKSVAVVPESNYGHTLESRPTFLVYLDNLPEDVNNFFFHIRDEHGDNVYGTFLPLPANTRILRVELPEDAPVLEVGELYKWAVAIPCSGDLQPDTPFVTGWIERVDSAVLVDGSFASELEAVYQYGQAGLWYDMIALLDELYQLHPQDGEIVTVWRDTLQGAGRQEMIDVAR